MLGLSTFLLTACAGGDGGGGSEPGGVTNQLGYESGVAPREQGLTTLEALGLYVLAPLTILLVVAALVWLPGVAKGARYRPARGWNAAPLWFGGPPDPAAAVESADPAGIVRGGASGNW
ncbi:MAG: hypothetical protein JWN88_1680 [Frankiales bacterium]|nr:hypothetical protein [Frankiales bacterium]